MKPDASSFPASPDPDLGQGGDRRWNRTAQAADAGLRLDRFWSRELAEESVSREKIKDWIKSGLALVNNEKVLKPNATLAGDEQLSLCGEALESELIPLDRDLDIRYQDRDLAIVAKPPGLTVHPAPSVGEPTLVHTLLHHFPQIAGLDPARPGIVHRLDKDTSGLMAVALTEAARLTLAEDFAERRTVKAYLALVTGRPPAQGIIDAPLGRHPRIRVRMAVRPKDGREARSTFRTLWTTPKGKASLVLVRIHTGRTHQIRVHLSHIGHPLLGDATYGYKPEALPGLTVPRVMLHSFFLGLTHPRKQTPLSFSLPPPGDFLEVLAALARRPLRLGLTGAAGSGKSALLRALTDLGLPCFSADAAVARLYARDGEAFVLLTGRFGPDLAAKDGSGLDRARLLSLMRGSESVRREVMDLIHPLVAREMERFFLSQARTGIMAAEIPLLLEADPSFRRMVDLAVGVFCPDEMRHARLLARGSAPDIPALLDSWQWPQADKMRACQLVVDNSGPPEALPGKAQALVQAARDLMAHREERFQAWQAGLWPELAAELEQELIS